MHMYPSGCKRTIQETLCKKGTIQDYFWFTSQRVEEPIYKDSDFDNIDLWLITHEHEDHLDSVGMSKISNYSKIISNTRASKILKENGKDNITVLSWKQKKEITIKGYTIEIEAIPAIHGVNPLSAFFAGKVNGYYVTISKDNEKRTIYITGDTVYTNKIIKTLKNREIDILIANMGAAKQGSWIMTLTLNAKMLAKMISKLNPKLVIPVHYGTFEHYKEPLERIKAINDDRIKIIEVGSTIKLSGSKTNN